MGNCIRRIIHDAVKISRTTFAGVHYSTSMIECTRISFNHAVPFRFRDFFSPCACWRTMLRGERSWFVPHSTYLHASSMSPPTGGVTDDPWLACAAWQGPLLPPSVNVVARFAIYCCHIYKKQWILYFYSQSLSMNLNAVFLVVLSYFIFTSFPFHFHSHTVSIKTKHKFPFHQMTV